MFTSGSIKLFEVAGTAVRVHLTFFLLLAWIAAIHWIDGGFQAAVTGVIFIIVLFACVVLHEFGHILVARRFGVKTRDVTLLPIGGVAAMDRIPEKPAEEIQVAIAGPAVNLVIATVLFLWIGNTVDWEAMSTVREIKPDLVLQIALANAVLFVFNLIPAFPMDGGRVLRAVLATRFGYARATQMAASVGQSLAIFFGVLGLLGNPILILIALFIFLAASGEAGYVQMREQSRGQTVGDAMVVNFETLSPTADVDAAASLLLKTTQQEFPVVDGGRRLRGVLTRQALIEALQTTGGQTPVIEIMTREVATVDQTSPLEPAMQILQRRQSPIIAVVDKDQKLVGYIDPQNLAEFFLIGSARELQRE